MLMSNVFEEGVFVWSIPRVLSVGIVEVLRPGVTQVGLLEYS